MKPARFNLAGLSLSNASKIYLRSKLERAHQQRAIVNQLWGIPAKHDKIAEI